MTHPTEAAIAQAFRERLESMYSPLTVREVMKAVETRARELGAEKGGDAEFVADICGSCQQVFYTPHDCPHATPPAQAAEAVERVARAIAAIARPNIGFEHLSATTTYECRRMARAAIAAMQAGEG